MDTFINNRIACYSEFYKQSRPFTEVSLYCGHLWTFDSNWEMAAIQAPNHSRILYRGFNIDQNNQLWWGFSPLSGVYHELEILSRWRFTHLFPSCEHWRSSEVLFTEIKSRIMSSVALLFEIINWVSKAGCHSFYVFLRNP